MLDTLPVVLITLVSRFLMPGDANCLARSFRDVHIDWMKVLFNYARVEAFHMEWCIVVDSICRAKAFYINCKTHRVTDQRAFDMFMAIKKHKLSDLRKAILDCPRLFRVHKFTLDDSFVVYSCKFEDGQDTFIRIGAVWIEHTGPMPTTLEDGTKLTCHEPISMLQYLDHQTYWDMTFNESVSDMFGNFRKYMTGFGMRTTDQCMINLNSRTAIIDLPKALFDGELYGSSSSKVPIAYYKDEEEKAEKEDDEDD